MISIWAIARRINNWDLVDVTCPHLVGLYLLDKDRTRLYELAYSDCLWEQRIAMVSTVTFIRNREDIPIHWHWQKS